MRHGGSFVDMVLDDDKGDRIGLLALIMEERFGSFGSVGSKNEIMK